MLRRAGAGRGNSGGSGSSRPSPSRRRVTFDIPPRPCRRRRRRRNGSDSESSDDDLVAFARAVEARKKTAKKPCVVVAAKGWDGSDSDSDDDLVAFARAVEERRNAEHSTATASGEEQEAEAEAEADAKSAAVAALQKDGEEKKEEDEAKSSSPLASTPTKAEMTIGSSGRRRSGSPWRDGIESAWDELRKRSPLQVETLDDVESDGDDEHRRKRRPRCGDPPHGEIDAASWDVIQRLQQDEAGADMGGKRPRPTTTEDDDAALARRLQAEENRAARARLNGPGSMEEALASLDKCQLIALRHVEARARPRHDAAIPKVRRRVMDLGYRPEDLDRCLEYVRDEAPIVIHLSEQCLSFLVKDTHYRNLFETATSGGSRDLGGRKTWERSMFGNCYDKASPHQRVKYGCLNLTGDIAGVQCARAYGDLYISLRSSVRHRCTFFDKDTGCFNTVSRRNNLNEDTLATSKYYAHILDCYTVEELKSILSLSRVGGGRSKCRMYKETQIHGPVCLASDVEALSVPGCEADASKQLKDHVNAFQKKANCTILWQGDLLGIDNRRQDPLSSGAMIGGHLSGIFTGYPASLSLPASSHMHAGTEPFSGVGHRLGGS